MYVKFKRHGEPLYLNIKRGAAIRSDPDTRKTVIRIDNEDYFVDGNLEQNILIANGGT